MAMRFSQSPSTASSNVNNLIAAGTHDDGPSRINRPRGVLGAKILQSIEASEPVRQQDVSPSELERGPLHHGEQGQDTQSIVGRSASAPLNNYGLETNDPMSADHLPHDPRTFRGPCDQFHVDGHGRSSYVLDLDGLRRSGNSKGSFQAYYDEFITTRADIDLLLDLYSMPESTSLPCFDRIRYSWLSAYRRLFAVVFLANASIIFYGVIRSAQGHVPLTVDTTAIAASVNLFALALSRHEHFINLIFRACSSLPHWMPLSVRRCTAKVYSYGGIHSGCGISATMWYLYFTILLGTSYKAPSVGYLLALDVTTAIMWLLLLTIVSLAYPTFRRRHHNIWELSHRYCAWAAICDFWAQTIVLTYCQSNLQDIEFGRVLITSPSFWLLGAISALLIHPWLYLRRIPVQSEKLSDHAMLLKFDHKTLDVCMGIRLSEFPLVENHGFATIPNADRAKGFSVIVSNAGDWTEKLIHNPPKYLWLRGAHTLGVMRVALLFNPVLVVATGSGIGPCLSFLQVRPDWPCRIIWSARAPEQNYGSSVLKAVLRADDQAIILDTQRTRLTRAAFPTNSSKKSIFSQLVHAAYKSINAQAVIIISNPKTTQEIVYDLETIRIPAFGAIFDS